MSLSRIAAFVRNILRRARVEKDLDDELRGYVDLVAAEKARQGMTASDAERAARLEVGGVAQVTEGVRDVRTGATLDVLLRDSRYAVRSLRKTPSFTIAAVLALALGIGANTAILSVVNAVLLRPLPYTDGDRLAVILHDGRSPVAPANFVDWRRQTQSFTEMAAAEYWTPNLNSGDDPEHLFALHVTPGMFPMLGVSPMLGRTFTSTEDVAGNDRVVVLGYGLWQRRFAADRNIIGRRITLDGDPYTVVGVMPQTFRFAPFWATRAELWAPLSLGARATERSGNSLRIFARLRPGVTLAQARADLATVTARLERENPGTNRLVVLQPLKDKVVGDIQTPLLVLLVAVMFVLLIACANVAHMLLARASARQKELAVRAALGATRTRLITQLLVESTLLAAGGAVVGILFARAGISALVSVAPAIIPSVSSVSIDGRVLLMTLAITALTAIAFGLVPALRAARVDLSGTFRDGDRASTEGHSRSRLRNTLVASEFALALVLLVGAGLMIRSVAALRSIDPGFDPRNVVTMTVSTSGTKEGDPGVRSSFYAEALEKVKAIPGVASASFVNHLPITGDLWGYAFWIQGRPKPARGDALGAAYRVVFPGYFRAMGIPILRGRDIAPSDRLGSQNVVVINEFMAAKHWPGENPIGKNIAFSDSAWVTIVGVVKNIVREDWAAPAEEEVFVPYFQERSYLTSTSTHQADLTLVARASCAGRTKCDPTAIAAPIVNVFRSMDGSMPISQVRTMTSIVEQATSESRFYLLLLAAFAVVALALAAVGIYGVMSYSVSRRTHEIGIRIALGAEPSAVRRLIVGQGMWVAAVGAAVGLVGALLLTRLMGRLLYGVAPSDPITFVGVTLVLCAVAFMASYLPARRATRIDPLRALRSN